MFTTAFMLLYGDYPRLHLNVLPKLFVNAPQDEVEIRLWLNVVCPETLAWLATHRRPNMVIYVSDQNVPKYKVMRQIFHDPKRPITSEWITWFDDDALITKSDWFDKTKKFIADTRGVTFFGQERRKGHQAGIRRFIEAASWYKKRKLQRIRGERGSKYHGPGIVFVQGSYWWIRTAVINQLNWPDARLSHNGGDTLLSEAVWQQHLPQHGFFYGVIPNNASRRGLSENPAGFKFKQIPHTDGKGASMVGRMSDYFSVLQAHGLEYMDDDDVIVIPSVAPKPKPAVKQPPRSRLELQFRKGK